MFKYFGSKYRLSRHYPAPRERTIIEPFAGSAAYSVAHRKTVDRVILVEKDSRIVELWIRLLGMSAGEILSLPPPRAGEESSDLLVALAAGRTTRDTPEIFRVSPRMEQRFSPMIRRIASVVDECRFFEVSQGDYTDAPSIEATWFIDPPYQHQGGRWDRSRGGRYFHPNRDLDYEELGRWCCLRSTQAVVCEQKGADWMPWNRHVSARDGTHDQYDEIWWESEGP